MKTDSEIVLNYGGIGKISDRWYISNRYCGLGAVELTYNNCKNLLNAIKNDMLFKVKEIERDNKIALTAPV